MPVSASGERLARSSIARRTSSSQSMSSGAKVTRPASSAASASSASSERATSAAPGSPRKRVREAREAVGHGQRPAVQRARARCVGPPSAVEHVGAVGGERELEERAREARALRRRARRGCARSGRAASARASCGAGPRARTSRSRFATSACVRGEHAARRRPAVLQDDDADLGPVEAQVEERVVELAEGAERPEVAAPLAHRRRRSAGSPASGPRTVRSAIRAAGVDLDA